jgi:CubicO group peptidase (beta-lactamase class C family)
MNIGAMSFPIRLIPVMAFFFLPRLEADDRALAALLEPIRAQYKLPALAGAIFTTDGMKEMAAVGVRKAGTTVAVTDDDQWHLGSDTKAMTALLAGSFVAEGKLRWTDKIVSFFPEIASRVPATMRAVTVDDVLRHQAGLIENLNWRALAMTGSLTEERLAAAEQALTSPAYAPGAFHYANTDYIVIGAILEKLGGEPWERLIRDRIFDPLGMTSAGFGGSGTLGEIDQPWPHFASGLPAPTNGPLMDNAAVMGPAGCVRCTIQDWVKFLTDQLRGGTGMKAHLPNDIYAAMQSAPAPGNYGYGWIICDRPWAGGKALNHAGSNTMNFCVCWLAPARHFGVVVCTNQGDQFPAVDAAASALIRYQQP